MDCYLISFEMDGLDDHSSLVQAIKDYRTWARINLTLYAVVTDQSAAEVRDNLLRYFSDTGRLFVIRSGVEAAWRNARCRDSWLKRNLVRGEGEASS